MKISEAEALAGGKQELAKALKVTLRAVQKWSAEGDLLPEDRYYQLAGLKAMKKWKPINGQKFPKQ